MVLMAEPTPIPLTASRAEQIFPILSSTQIQRHYRRLPIQDLSRFEGAGVYYGATLVEAQLCSSEEVIVAGGGNSAGQAAVFLAQNTKQLYLLVRGSGLADSMSRYLIRRIEQAPNILAKRHGTRRSGRQPSHSPTVPARNQFARSFCQR
jgi:thioredoxin reductase